MWRRSRLVHLLIDKEQTDKSLFDNDAANQRIDWYNVNLDNLLEPAMRTAFHLCAYDQETEQFLNQSLATSNNICLQVSQTATHFITICANPPPKKIYYSVMATILSTFLTKTSINGFLNRGSMFVFSRANFHTFLGLPSEWSAIDRQLLDIGAGDGGITAVLKQFYNKVSVVEASKIMEWRLAQRGFRVLQLEKWMHNGGNFDLICALNLLDRHQNPAKLLADIHSLAVESNCPVLISLVLPISRYVEFMPEKNINTMPIIASQCGNSFESQAGYLAKEVFKPAGFEVIRWTKLPYLCEGDLTRAFYKLDDAVFLLKAVPMPKRGGSGNDEKSIVDMQI